jgi:hypothetical protein
VKEGRLEKSEWLLNTFLPVVAEREHDGNNLLVAWGCRGVAIDFYRPEHQELGVSAGDEDKSDHEAFSDRASPAFRASTRVGERPRPED